MDHFFVSKTKSHRALSFTRPTRVSSPSDDLMI